MNDTAPHQFAPQAEPSRTQRTAALVLGLSVQQRHMLVLAVQGVPHTAIAELTGATVDHVNRQIDELADYLGVRGMDDPLLETAPVLTALQQLPEETDGTADHA